MFSCDAEPPNHARGGAQRQPLRFIQTGLYKSSVVWEKMCARLRRRACESGRERLNWKRDDAMPKTKGKPDGSKREELIDTALRLFSRHGYRATGIDTILAEAGVAKMTLYHHFKSKDELIVAALKKRDAEWRTWFVRRVDELGRTPREKL